MSGGLLDLIRTGGTLSLPLPTGESGYMSRECPDCTKVFKIMPGTGLQDTDSCYCPYCGRKADHSYFHTEDQIDYATDEVANAIGDEVFAYLDEMAQDFNRSTQRQNSLLSLSMKVSQSSSPTRYPSDPKLEEHIECSNCTLRYAVYGVYAYCPDCARHNALQILNKNLDICIKLLDSANASEQSLFDSAIQSVLARVVAASDGFGREVCRANATKSIYRGKLGKITFQNLVRAQESVKKYFDFDIAAALDSQDWEFALRCFQKRHVFEHKSGIVDEEYMSKAGDCRAILGRKLTVSEREIQRLVGIVRVLGKHIMEQMEGLE